MAEKRKSLMAKVCVSLSRAQLDRIEQIAAERECTRSEVMRMVLYDGLSAQNKKTETR
jgi:metal-responsive CopG/Arc/MetJ family transcriptional regulator